MNYKINIYNKIEDIKIDYTEFLKDHENSSIFQSTLWADFSNNFFKRQYYFIEIRDENDYIKLISLILKYDLPFKNNYLYCPCGPIFWSSHNTQNEELMDIFLKEVEKISIQNNSIFFRMDPQIDLQKIHNANILENWNYFYNLFIQKNKFVISKEQKQPENTLSINLDLSEEELLKQMHPKGRYNIKVAEKNNIKIERTIVSTEKEFDAFFDLMNQTTKRDGFFGHNKDYYKNLLDIISQEDGSIYLYSAFHEDKIIATAITTFYGKKSIYYYGASSNENRNLMAPYILQWTMIKDAKKSGCKSYDFLGISPKAFSVSILNSQLSIFIVEGFKRYDFTSEVDAEKFLSHHKYNGITNFKTKFGGETKVYIGAIDKIYNDFWYKFIIFTKNIRSIMRKIFKIKI